MGKKNKKRLLPQIELSRTGLIVVIAAGVVILLGIVLAVVLVFLQPKPADEKTNKQETANEIYLKQAKQDIDVRDDAQKALSRGDTNKAEDIYGDAIKAEPDPVRKVKLSIDQSKVLYGAGKYNEAIAVAKHAEVLTEDKFLVADWLSRVYEAREQYAEAANYYSLAGKWASSETNTLGRTKAYYDNQAARVSALVGG